MDARVPGQTSPDAGIVACLLAGALLVAFALTVDFPKAAFGFQSDEATYYSLGHSLARDLDFTYERQDLERVWEEFPSGPEGIFLKRGDDGRIYYAKSYAYPLLAAPFVALAGTNGFLLLHAILLTLDLLAAYLFLRARSTPVAAAAFALVFVFASVVPVYLVWLTPEVFNFSFVLLGLFAWAYKEVAPAPAAPARWERLLHGPRSDWLAAVLLGVAAFSKPTNLATMVPLGLLFLHRRQWLRGALTGAVFAATVGGLFLVNVAITGEANYQGGDRKTFYGGTRFPYQRHADTFDNTGMGRATDAVPTGVLFNRAALTEVLPRNVGYFVAGRHTGIAPYFFPGVLAVLLFLAARRERRPFQWCVLAGIGLASLALIVYMPFTYSGGGGPVGNRYFLGFYAMFLFVTPALATWRPALAAALIGGAFTAQLVANPFYTSFHPAEHPKSGLFRMLPVELSLVNDLPVNVTPSRVKRTLGGEPPLLGYFLDDNAYLEDDGWFWVRGESRADVILRAPASPRGDAAWHSHRLRQLIVEIRGGDVPATLTIGGDARSTTLSLGPGETTTATVAVQGGLPYQPVPGQPANFVYLLTLGASDGFVPLFTSGAPDPRFLGVRVRLRPLYDRPEGAEP